MEHFAETKKVYDDDDHNSECKCDSCQGKEWEYVESDDGEEYTEEDYTKFSLRNYFTPTARWKEVDVAYFLEKRSFIPDDWAIQLSSKPSSSKKDTLRYKIEFSGKLPPDSYLLGPIGNYIHSILHKLEADGKIESDFKMRLY